MSLECSKTKNEDSDSDEEDKFSQRPRRSTAGQRKPKLYDSYLQFFDYAERMSNLQAIPKWEQEEYALGSS